MKKILLKKIKFFCYLLPYVFVFIASLYKPSDPDLGWHLRYGEYFFQHHTILRDNIFSSMMPNYHWANESWGTDIVTYAIFKVGGFFALTIVSSIIVTLTFLFFSKIASLTFFEESLFFPILIYLESSVNSFSFRGQQISFLFLGILFFLLKKYKSNSKIIFLVPVLFLIWCNIHGEFFLGIVLFGIWIVISSVKNIKRNYKKILFLSSIFILTLVATLINPFGIGIHLFALSYIDAPLLKKISEYVPFVIFSQGWWNQVIAIFLLISLLMFLFFKKSLAKYLNLYAIPLILIAISFLIKRYAWPGYYLLLPVFHVFGEPLTSRLNKYSIVSAVIISIFAIAYSINLKIPLSQFESMDWSEYCTLQSVPCSSQSAEYLRRHNLTHNLFSYYDWGGWLIWNYPSVKPSIDGRMSLWRDKNGYSAIEEYGAYQNAKKNIYDDSSFDVIYIPMDQQSPLYKELSQQQDKWKLVYEDNFAGIVVRRK